MTKTNPSLFTTPLGEVAGFTAIQEARPNFKGTADEYQIVVAFSAKDYAAMAAKLHALRDAYVKETLDGLEPPKRKVLAREMSVKDVGSPEYGDDGEPTGRILIKFKQQAVIKGVSRKTGKEFAIEKKVSLVDSTGAPIKAKVPLGKGSIVAVSFEPNPYFAAKEREFGISFNRLVGVQLVRLVKYAGTGQMSAEDMGFEAQDDGFRVEDYIDDAEDTDGAGSAQTGARSRDLDDDDIPF